MYRTATVSVFLIGLLGISAGASAGTIYVSTAGNNANTGSSWSDAKQTVQAGLNAAASGSQVWVAAGTYLECITLKSGVALYGGFAGNETDLSQRNWQTNVTILDGNQGGSVVSSPYLSATSTRIDGFTICNGKASNSSGGGIYCSSSSLTITNNTISGNSASYGAGIYCDYSSPTITNNTITGNTASYDGGGIYSNSSSSPTITNNTITGNTAYFGGAIYCDYSSPTITNNTITGNTAYFGGGIYCDYSSPTITSNTITGNTASAGGGIYCYSSSYPTITNTIIAFNSSGIYSSYSTPTLRYCCVYGNVTYNYQGMTDPTGTNGNISADPQLADLGSYNVHLQPTSPCIDAGDDAAVQAGWIDIDGQLRQQAAHADIGADESDGTSWPAAAAILFVCPSGNDSNDGLSWASAKQTVQAGIDAGGTGSAVWVAGGTYFGTIRLGFGMAIYGGFAGNETDLSQRNWRTNVTILDGNQGGSVVTTPVAATASTRIDGFTIRNGNASNGGGINGTSSSPTITNNTITGNTASGYGGAGIYCNSSSPTITNNTITGNTASNSYGGGVYCHSSSPTITNNTITGNTASNSYGGGIYCTSSSSPTITNSIIAFNSSGIYCSSSSSKPTARYGCVYGNVTYNYQGMTNPTGTNGNISIDPLFVQATAPYDVHLLLNSPCINTGDPSFNGTGLVDLDGNPRVLGGRVDMGVYESIPSPVIESFTSPRSYMYEGCTVTLTATVSHPDAGQTLTANFSQTAGQTVALGTASTPGSPPATWTFPFTLSAHSLTSQADGTLTFQLTATDNGSPALTSPAATVTVQSYMCGDISHDGYVNVGDLQLLVAAWGSGPNYVGPADLQADGLVNVADLQLLVANWARVLN